MFSFDDYSIENENDVDGINEDHKRVIAQQYHSEHIVYSNSNHDDEERSDSLKDGYDKLNLITSNSNQKGNEDRTHHSDRPNSSALTLNTSIAVSITKKNQRFREKDENDNQNVKDVDKDISSKCMINVHGFPHSGTGVLYQTVWESFPSEIVSAMADPLTVNKSISFQHPNIYEGILQQNIYPKTRDRNSFTCTNMVKNMKFALYEVHFFCPSMLLSQSTTNKRAQMLWQQWSKYWKPQAKIVIQKSPTFDAVYLQRLYPKSFHAFVMRHPLVWHAEYAGCGNDKVALCGLIWVSTWRRVLQQILFHDLKNYIIIFYEALVNTPNKMKREIKIWAESDCIKDIDKPHLDHDGKGKLKYRNLNLREAGVLNKNLVWNPSVIQYWNESLHKEFDAPIIDMLEPITRLFGYSLRELGNKSLRVIKAIDQDQQQQSKQQEGILMSSTNPWRESLIMNVIHKMTSALTEIEKKLDPRHHKGLKRHRVVVFDPAVNARVVKTEQQYPYILSDANMTGDDDWLRQDPMRFENHSK